MKKRDKNYDDLQTRGKEDDLLRQLKEIEDDLSDIIKNIRRESAEGRPLGSLYQEKQNLEARKRDLLEKLAACGETPPEEVKPRLDNNQAILATSSVRRKDKNALLKLNNSNHGLDQ